MSITCDDAVDQRIFISTESHDDEDVTPSDHLVVSAADMMSDVMETEEINPASSENLGSVDMEMTKNDLGVDPICNTTGLHVSSLQQELSRRCPHVELSIWGRERYPGKRDITNNINDGITQESQSQRKVKTLVHRASITHYLTNSYIYYLI